MSRSAIDPPESVHGKIMCRTFIIFPLWFVVRASLLLFLHGLNAQMSGNKYDRDPAAPTTMCHPASLILHFHDFVIRRNVFCEVFLLTLLFSHLFFQVFLQLSDFSFFLDLRFFMVNIVFIVLTIAEKFAFVSIDECEVFTIINF